MIDHTRVNVEDFEESIDFCAVALAPFGYELLLEFHGTVPGFGEAGKPGFGISQGEANTPWVYLAFRVNTRKARHHTRRRWAAVGRTAVPVCGQDTIQLPRSLCLARTDTRPKRSALCGVILIDKRSALEPVSRFCTRIPAFYSSVPGAFDQDVTTAATLSVFR